MSEKLITRCNSEISDEALTLSLKQEITAMDASRLPLQKALRQSSYVSNSPFTVVPLELKRGTDQVTFRTGIFYTGIIAGSCCSDDPTPCDELNEHCELEFLIDVASGETQIRLVD